jgi:hypothetical protein
MKRTDRRQHVGLRRIGQSHLYLVFEGNKERRFRYRRLSDMVTLPLTDGDRRKAKRERRGDTDTSMIKRFIWKKILKRKSRRIWNYDRRK